MLLLYNYKGDLMVKLIKPTLTLYGNDAITFIEEMEKFQLLKIKNLGKK